MHAIDLVQLGGEVAVEGEQIGQLVRLAIGGNVHAVDKVGLQAAAALFAGLRRRLGGADQKADPARPSYTAAWRQKGRSSRRR